MTMKNMIIKNNDDNDDKDDNDDDGGGVCVPQIMCFYFVFTVFSTVGFGDIFAVNTPERVC